MTSLRGGLIAIIAILTPLYASASARDTPSVLTRIGDVRRLTPAQAATGVPVRLEAVVTYYHHDWEMLFVQDETGSRHVRFTNGAKTLV